MPTDAIAGTKVEDMREDLRAYHADKRASQELDDRYYNQEVESVARDHLPDDIPIYQSSLSTDVVDQVSDQLRTDEPNLNYGALTDSDREITRKSKFESWGKQVILDDQLGQDIDAYSQAGKDLALRGEAVIKRLHNTTMPEEPVLSDFSGQGKRDAFKEAHGKWEAEIAATSPLSPARAIDPLNVFIPPNAVNPLPYIIEHQERRQVDIWDDYPDWKTKLAGKVWSKDGKDTKLTVDELEDPLRKVDWLEYYSKDQYILLIDGIEVVSGKNPYGFVPYSHVHSGLGRVDRNSSSAAKAASILSKIRGELLSEIVLKTIMYELAQSYVFPRIRVPDGREDIVREGMRHRGILRYDPQDPQGANSIQWLDPIAINPAVSQFLGEAQAAIARRVNPILGGQGDAEFGVLEALRIGQAVKGIQEITTNLNRMATESVRQAAKMMIALDKSMTVYGTSDNGGRDYTMKPDDFKSYKQLEVRFEAVDPVEQTRKQQAGMVLFRGGAISRRTLQTSYLNDIVKNPVQEDARMGVEAAEAAFFGSEQFLAWAVSKYQAIQQNEGAEKERQAVRNNAIQSSGRTQAPTSGAQTGRTAEVETLAGGGADASARDGAAQAAIQAT